MGDSAQIGASEEGPSTPAIRVASSADAEAIRQLLHDFNSEFDEPTPGPVRLAERIRRLLAAGDTTVLLGGTGRTASQCCASEPLSGARHLSVISPSCTSFRSAGVAGSAVPCCKRRWMSPELGARITWTSGPAKMTSRRGRSTRASAGFVSLEKVLHSHGAMFCVGPGGNLC